MSKDNLGLVMRLERDRVRTEHVRQIERLTQIHKRDKARIAGLQARLKPMPVSLLKKAENLGISFSAAKILYEMGWNDAEDFFFKTRPSVGDEHTS